jgi:hypothetical protein
LENVGTTAHRFTLDDFIARYTDTFGEEPALTRLQQPIAYAG